ncbi:MAG: leucine-rich repeat domain-containing protein [Clostridiales bacterium]|nr:leucine-rich repeat domain-containing protein [Clostridiales bacterium]
MIELSNETGTFTVTDDGELVRFSAPDADSDCFLSFPGPARKLNLYQLNIPEGVRILPENAFRGCHIDHLVLPDSLELLGSGKGGAFSRCQLGSITLPESTTLGPQCFSGSYLKKINISYDASPELFHQLAHALRFTFFWHGSDLMKDWPEQYVNEYKGCKSGKELTALSNSSGTFMVDSDGVLMDFIPAGSNLAQSDNEKALVCLHIPDGVCAIPQKMFYSYSISESITFPASLKYIGTGDDFFGAFAGCTLPDLVLPENLELFGCFAFGACTIRSLTIPGSIKDSLLHIGVRQFKDCKIDEIRIPAEYRSLYEKELPSYPYMTFTETTGNHGEKFCCIRSNMAPLGWGNEVLNILYSIVNR